MTPAYGYKWDMKCEYCSDAVCDDHISFSEEMKDKIKSNPLFIDMSNTLNNREQDDSFKSWDNLLMTAVFFFPNTYFDDIREAFEVLLWSMNRISLSDAVSVYSSREDWYDKEANLFLNKCQEINANKGYGIKGYR